MKNLATILTVLVAIPVIALGETAPVIHHTIPYHLETGIHNGPSDEGTSRLVFTEIVRVPSTPWVRLRFSEAYLGVNSYLQIRSLLDNRTQTLDAAALDQWENTTAYFNGEAVEVRLYVGTGDEGIFSRLSEVDAGEFMPGDNTESQCGPSDDRIPSADPKEGRLLNIGCTAWLICDGRLISAGHCLSSAGSINVVEFNVPASLPNGTIQHPGPEDQYTYVTNSRVYTNGGIGNDWGVFEVNTNTTTGMTALEAQGEHFELVQNLGPSTIRITGYGVDFNNGDRNQVQQTHAGPNAGSSGTTMRYQADTEGGNSGSPVIDDATGNAVGVHTHGGCSTGGGGNNSGTSLFHAAFWAEVSSNPCGGGGIPCEDIANFQAKCTPAGAINIRLTMTDNSHSGETVVFTIDGDEYPADIIRAGGTRAQISVAGAGAGPHTVALADPAACESPIGVNCQVASGSTDLTSWDDEDADHIVAQRESSGETKLFGNHPNPFNPSTSISYTVGTPGWVTLKVFNTLGQEVATLVDGYQDAGQRSAVWNGANESGQPVSSGLYFYRLTAGPVVQSGRMILAK